MCAINGIFAYQHVAHSIDRTELARTRDHMAARGPDGKGEWIAADGRLGFGHRRLSIIDLSVAGSQPMPNADGTLIVTFNGEIYNYRELRRSLETRGYRFRSNSDTEVLLHLYAEKGEAMVHDLRGMFAFAIWDTRHRRLFMARDPYGIKPLYYADDGRTLRFASQVKALLAGGAVADCVAPAGVVGFYLWGSVPEPFTTYQAIRALPAGSWMNVRAEGADEPVRYFSIADVYRRAAGKSGVGCDADPAVCEALLDSVRAHLVADVSVGAFLSAGIDSGALLGLMRDAGRDDIATLTVAFEEFRGSGNDESLLAAEVAANYGMSHETRIVTEAEFHGDLPRILGSMDQVSIDGLNSWFVSKAIRERGLKVAISGLGGDELFGGYPSFRDLPRWVGLLGPLGATPRLSLALRSLLGKAAARLPFNPKLAGLPELGGTYAGAYLLRRGLFMPWELDSVLDHDLIEAGLASLPATEPARAMLEDAPDVAFAKVAVLESSVYMRNQLLRDTDWASMAHSLEVRVPLVDPVLLKAAAPHVMAQSGRPSKALLAGAPSKPLPDRVVNRSKTGFSTPIASWLQRSALVLDGAPSTVRPGWPWARRWADLVARHALDRACFAT